MGETLLNVLGVRKDGRIPTELRNIECKIGVFSEPDGSAYITQGLTKVLVAVYGPHQPRQKSKTQHDVATINCQYSMASFSTAERRSRPHGDRKSLEMAMNLRDALSSVIQVELYPRSQIDIYFEVLEADGGNFSACINAATLALIDAGIPIREYICSTTASLTDDEIPLLDITHMEEMIGGPALTLVCLPDSGKIVHLDMSQRFHLVNFDKVLTLAMKGCREIKHILDEAVRTYIADVGSVAGWTVKHSGNKTTFL